MEQNHTVDEASVDKSAEREPLEQRREDFLLVADSAVEPYSLLELTDEQCSGQLHVVVEQEAEAAPEGLGRRHLVAVDIVVQQGQAVVNTSVSAAAVSDLAPVELEQE